MHCHDGGWDIQKDTGGNGLLAGPWSSVTVINMGALSLPPLFSSVAVHR